MSSVDGILAPDCDQELDAGSLARLIRIALDEAAEEEARFHQHVLQLQELKKALERGDQMGINHMARLITGGVLAPFTNS